MLLGSPLRVYLDTADLHRISDGEAAPSDQTLREAIAETGARVVCSLAHLVDLVEADDATIARWWSAVDSLGRAEWIFIDGGEPRFEAYRPQDVAPWLALVRPAFLPVRTSRQAAAEAAHDANAHASGPPVRGRKLRANVEAVLDGPLGPLLAAAGSFYGMSRDQMVARVCAESADALAQGDVAGAIRLRVDADRDRYPCASDMADALHLEALPHVHVFTADRYMSAKIEATLRRVPVGLSLPRRIRDYHLDEVADALRAAACPAGPLSDAR